MGERGEGRAGVGAWAVEACPGQGSGTSQGIELVQEGEGVKSKGLESGENDNNVMNFECA